MFLNNGNQELTILNAKFVIVSRVGVEGEGFVTRGGGVGWGGKRWVKLSDQNAIQVYQIYDHTGKTDFSKLGYWNPQIKPSLCSRTADVVGRRIVLVRPT